MSETMIYVTAGSNDEARRIGHSLVEARLAACANILPPMTSVYWWEGAVQEDSEVAMILKTRQDLVESLIERIRELHSYDCPCVVALPITGGNPDFLQWIDSQTR
jgi:periplasmic divalent cation tolerance protein